LTLSDTPPMRRLAVGPVGLVIATVLLVWFASGVGAGDIARFLGYETAFIALPGTALLWALRGREGWLLSLALGWPLGQTLEILAFSATAATGLRGLFVAYPIVVIVASALWIWRRPSAGPTGSRGDAVPRRVAWLMAAALALGLGYICLEFLPSVPLPSLAQSVSYYVDFPNFIGLIAEVRNHWPPTSPGLSGVPLHYQWFVFYQMAAINQVTNVSITTIAFRLDFVPTILVIGCQLFVVGRFIGRRAWVGVLAIVVAFFLGQLDLTTDAAGPGASPFFDSFSFHLWASWTFPFGLTFFLGLLYVIAERVRATTWHRSTDVRSWALIGLLMIGASGAKATILPVVVVGTGMYAVVVFVSKRTVPANALLVCGLGIAVFGATFAIVYGGGVPGTVIGPLASLQYTVPVKVADKISSGLLRAVVLPFAYTAGLAGELLPFAGVLYLLRRRHRAQLSRYALCLCMFGGGIVIASVFHQVGSSELYFQDTGYAAGFIVSAAGLRLAWLDVRTMGAAATRAVTLAFVGWVALILALSAVTSPTLAHGGLVLRYGAITVIYVLFVAMVVDYSRTRHLRSGGVLLIGLIPLVASAALTTPIQVSPTLGRLLSGRAITVTQPDPQQVRGITPGLLLALQWLQNHTPLDTVFAVNNHWIDAAGTDGRNQNYSAFSERQVFVESYNPDDYGITVGVATPAEVNFQYRRRLNDAVFDHADEQALAVLTQTYGVRYLFVDRVHVSSDPAVVHLGTVVFSNNAATIVAVG
jgi:hypothetical protein